jgi:hypothetical protein
MKSSELQAIVLKAIARPGADTRLGKGRHYLAEEIYRTCHSNDRPNQHQIFEVFWGLVAQGLAYIDISQPSPENWKLYLTESGWAAVRDEYVNPDDPSGYLSGLFKSVPNMSDLVRLYINEAVNTYYRRCYLSCTVMLGVAAEAAFMEVATSFVSWCKSGPSDKLDKILRNPRSNYINKFIEFRKRLVVEKNRIPPELRDGLDIHMGSVLDLLRMCRNDAGHPTGRQFHRDDCFTSLRIFARLAKRIYMLKKYFEADTSNMA